MALPTVADLKTHLNMTSSANDGELQDMLDAAIEIVESFVGPLTASDVTEVHRNVSAGQIVLRQVPVGGLVSVSARHGIETVPLTLSDYDLDATTGILRVALGYGFLGTYEVTYSAGRDIVPAAVTLAILIIAAHLWETQRGVSPTALQQPDEVEAFAGAVSYAIPNRAKELLQPFTLGPTIA